MSGAKSEGTEPLSKRRGDCAEYLVEQEMEKKDYEPVMIGDEKATDVLTNGSGHGMDHLMMDKNGGFLVVGETKANRARLNKHQKEGAISYLTKQIEDMTTGVMKGDGRYKILSTYSDEKKKNIRTTLKEMKAAIKSEKVRGELYRVKLKPDDDKDSKAYTINESDKEKNRCNAATDKDIEPGPW